MFFDMMNKRETVKYIPSLIYRKSNKILFTMNVITGEYVTLEDSINAQ